MHRFAMIVILGFALSFGAATSLMAQEEKKAEEIAWKTHLELSYVKTSGNTDVETLSGRFEVKREEKLNRYYFLGDYLTSEDDGDKTAKKYSVSGRYDRLLSDRLFAFFSATYYSDEFSGYDYRMWGGPGLGYDFIKTDVHYLKGSASINAAKDKYSEFPEGEDSTDTYASGIAEATYEWKIKEGIKFKQFANYIVSLEETEKYFVNSISALEVKLNSYLSLGLSYIVNYQGQPPDEDIERTDTTFLTSLIIDF